MSPQELEMIRQRWKKSGEVLCYHPVIVPLRDDRGKTSGTHVCGKCGVVVSERAMNGDRDP